jgi:hypothetical protein
MLSSITPLGERSRGNRWWLTVAAYLLGSVAGGAAVGAALGGVGAVLRGAGLDTTASAIVAVAVGAVALAFDASGGRLALPHVRRQVNEDWMTSYRGWVYGFAWGLQLGMGLVTIVTAAVVYLVFVLAFLTGDVLLGLAVGATFGGARGLVVLVVARVSTPDALLAFHRRLQRRAPAAQVAAATGDAVVVVAGIAVLLR